MKTFFRENHRTMTKMIVNQVGMMIFGFVVAQATCRNETLLLLGSVFSVLFYMVLIYNASWEAGAKDKIRIDGGRLRYQPLKGLYMSLVANIPNILLAMLVMIGYVFGRIDGGFAYEWAGNLYVITNFITRIFEAMYLGLIQLYSPNNPVAFLLIILPALLISCLGYQLGAKTIRLAACFGIKSKDAKKIEEQERRAAASGEEAPGDGRIGTDDSEDDRRES